MKLGKKAFKFTFGSESPRGVFTKLGLAGHHSHFNLVGLWQVCRHVHFKATQDASDFI